MVIKQQQGFCIGEGMSKWIQILMYKRKHYNRNMPIIPVCYSNQEKTKNSKSLSKSNIPYSGLVQLNFMSNFFTATY